jgi:hypothetical protein
MLLVCLAVQRQSTGPRKHVTDIEFGVESESVSLFRIHHFLTRPVATSSCNIYRRPLSSLTKSIPHCRRKQHGPPSWVLSSYRQFYSGRRPFCCRLTCALITKSSCNPGVLPSVTEGVCANDWIPISCGTGVRAGP